MVGDTAVDPACPAPGDAPTSGDESLVKSLTHSNDPAQSDAPREVADTAASVVQLGASVDEKDTAEVQQVATTTTETSASCTGRMDASRSAPVRASSSSVDSASDDGRRSRSISRDHRPRREPSYDAEIRREHRRDRSRSRSNSRRFGRAEITPARGPSQAGCASRIWVGGLPSDVREVELEDRFGKIGRVTDVKICQSSRDTYAFLQFDTEGAAAEAIEDVDQTKFGGFTIKVAHATRQSSESRRPYGSYNRDWKRPSYGGGRWGGNYSGGGYSSGYRRGYDRREGSSSGGGEDWYRGDSRGGRRDDYGRDITTRRDYPDYSPPSSRSRPAERQGSWDRDGGGRRVGGDDGVSFYDDKEMPRSGRHGGTAGGRGALQLKLENLPEDMSWQELKQLGKDYGSSCSFARTFREGRVCCGVLEYTDPAQVEEVLKSLDGRRIQGCPDRLRITRNEGQPRDTDDSSYDIKRYDRPRGGMRY
ncbi:Arginine/serine-rich-splicing factor, putative [Perkinsus marinus ATCC 50983]|uniref:Arginine/serine-rich-splicing factor, putative n=1 Tax=Perkinsus marinus (strain ATCC 50983 / TXsc) TaxID=423536 RepID=C5LVA8_PERM5|nr:Arginine/serine-rich-splicing factor, putative [Perkinsus marinus ATCC 50983]EEQ99346.1 Arginine/serine-rich-splicing factor, putative [Perkinsus marinus ATCC 50983]|eukprot:XP_002766629.1 Arginine/serine-rich-splicing factor, putative [Perkinsus marinus ATCC 50983]